MNTTDDSDFEARLNRLNRQIERLNHSLLSVKMWLGMVSVLLAETILFDLMHSAKGL